MLSFGLAVFAIFATQMKHPIGQLFSALSGMLCLYWGIAYRKIGS